MPIDPADLARSLGALDALNVERGLARTVQQVVDSATSLFDADRAGLTLVDHAGALRWASASDQVVEGEERLAQGPCMVAFAQRAPAAVRDISAEPDWSELAQVRIDEGIHAALSVPVEVDGGPVGTLDIDLAAPREWDASEVAALQTYAGLVASLLVAAVTAQVKGRLADQLQGAMDHRVLIEQAEGVLIDREGLDAQAAFEWLRRAARSPEREVVEVAREVLGGAALPSDRLAQARAQMHEATDREITAHERDSELHDGAAQRYERRGDPARAQTERLQAAAARGRITDAEAEQHRADEEPPGS